MRTIGRATLLVTVFGVSLMSNPARAQGDDAAVEQRMMALSETGLALAAKGQYVDAIRAYEEAIRMRPESGDVARSRARRWAQNNLAWLLATAPDSAVRDGPRALALAEALVAWKADDAAYLDTYAAAHAEVGRFDDAVRTQHTALSGLGRGALRDEYERHLKSYEDSKPWREPTAPAPPVGDPADELGADYPKPPRTLDGDPATSAVLLVDIDLKGAFGQSRVSGVALVMDGTLVRAAPLKGDLVAFHALRSGTYSLRFLRVDVFMGGDLEPRETLVLPAPPTADFQVTVDQGVHYLGVVIVKGRRKLTGWNTPEYQVVYDASKEAKAWSAFKDKYADGPWATLADQRILALRSPGGARE
jgi:hypothetical protein